MNDFPKIRISPHFNFDGFKARLTEAEDIAAKAAAEAIVAQKEADQAQTEAEQAKSEVQKIEATLAPVKTKLEKEFAEIMAKIEAAQTQAQAAKTKAKNKAAAAFRAHAYARSTAEKAAETAWSTKNIFFSIPEVQAIAEMETQDKDEVKSDSSSVSCLSQKFAIRIINAAEYSNRNQTDPQIAIIRHIFENAAFQNFMRPATSQTTFLAVNENDTIIGYLYGCIEEENFVVKTVVIGKNFQEMNFSKEQIEKRLYLKALEKTQELGIKLFCYFDFPLNTPNLDEIANKKAAFFTSFREDGVKVVDRFGRWGVNEKRLSIKMKPKSFNAKQALEQP